MTDTTRTHGHNAAAEPRRRDVLALGAAGLAATAAGLGPARSQAPVELTLWSWVPRIQRQVDLFQAAHPNIKVSVVHAGQGLAHHTRLRNALRAGTGAPDVAHMEYFYIPSYRLAKALVDIGPLGANAAKDEYLPTLWQQVSEGDKVFGMPWDTGPLGLIYREDIFRKHNLKTPATWDEFAEEAIKFKRAEPDSFLTNVAFSTGPWCNAMFWQGGSRPFTVDGTNISIAINDEPAKKVARYWQALIDQKVVDTKPIFATEWYTSLDQGRYASWISAAWGPLFLSQFVKNSSGLWRAAAIPQWKAGERVSANWGGSTLAVIEQSKHKREAAMLAIFLTSNPESTALFTTDQSLFPVTRRLHANDQFANATSAFYGNQPINRVFIESAAMVDPTYAWSPFQDYVHAQLGTELGAAANGQGTLVQALDRLQDNVVRYARQQGFTVRT